MTTTTDDLRLAADFPPATYDDWRKLVDGVLKGAPFEKLVGKTYDGLEIEPIYPHAKGASPIPGRAAATPWQTMQRIDHPDAAKANAQALHELENGASGLELEFAGGPGARGFGIADATPEKLKRVFDGVLFDAGIAIALNPVLGRENAGVNLAGLIEARGVDPAKVDIRFNYQALSTMAVRGSTAVAWPEMEKPFAKMIGELMSRGFKGPFALADGRPIHDAIRTGSGFFQHGTTYHGHAAACAGALAVQRRLHEEGVLGRVKPMGELLEKGVRERFARHPNVGDIRGRGLFWALELVRDRQTQAPFDPALRLHARVKAEALKEGLLCYPMGGTIDGRQGDHVLLAPPFIIEAGQIEELLHRLDAALERALRTS